MDPVVKLGREKELEHKTSLHETVPDFLHANKTAFS
jgi:hypothetical protein